MFSCCCRCNKWGKSEYDKEIFKWNCGDEGKSKNVKLNEMSMTRSWEWFIQFFFKDFSSSSCSHNRFGPVFACIIIIVFGLKISNTFMVQLTHEYVCLSMGIERYGKCLQDFFSSSGEDEFYCRHYIAAYFFTNHSAFSALCQIHYSFLYRYSTVNVYQTNTLNWMINAIEVA